MSAACGLQAAPDDPHFNASGTWDQDYADQWALQEQRIYADIAPSKSPANVIVAVIDTGLDYTHEDLAAEKLWRNPREQANRRDDDGNGYVDDLFGWNFVDNSNNPWDESGHGTHIAGLIAACTDNGVGIAGANPHARIMPLKVANFAGQARSSDVASAIYYAVDHGARIINLSLGGELVTALEIEAARYAAERDVLLIVAAGNSGAAADQQGSYATLEDALVVGASTVAGARAGFSNFGASVALLAPGVDLLSLRATDTDFIALTDPLDYVDGGAFVGEGDQYYRASGTSFAAALTTGIASRLLGLRPELDATGLQRLLMQSALDVAPPGIDQLSGFGRLDYLAAYATETTAHTEARLISASLELADTTLWINLMGTAVADDFTSAELFVRAGQQTPQVASTQAAEAEDSKSRKRTKKKKNRKKSQNQAPDPAAWQSLAILNQPVKANRLGRFSIAQLSELTGNNSWELKLVVTGAAGQREAYLSLALPEPEADADEEVAGR